MLAVIVSMTQNQDCFRGVISEEKMAEILACKYVEEFKASFMINQCGSESINHYYSEISLTGRLNRIKVPCLILQANDDMFQVREYSTIPYSVLALYQSW